MLTQFILPNPPPPILRPAGLLLPLFLPQDVVNAPADLLGFFHFPFQCKIPPVERFPLGGQLGIFRFPCLYRQGGLAVHHKSKGRGASPYSLRPAPVPAPVCAAPLRWMGGFDGGCNEKSPYRSRSVRFVYSNFSENDQCVRSAYGYVISAFAKSKCLYFIVIKDNGTFLWV